MSAPLKAEKIERPGRPHDRASVSGGFWFVPTDVAAGDLDIAGLVVASGDTVIADCRSQHLPDRVCRANARAISALPRMIAALERAENYFGDLPARDGAAMKVYADVLQALQEAGLRRRNGL